MFNRLIWRKVNRRRWIFILTIKEETRIGTKDGTNVEDNLQDEERTNVELGSQDKRFSSNLTSLLIITSLE
jgi:hypothetical protein